MIAHLHAMILTSLTKIKNRKLGVFYCFIKGRLKWNKTLFLDWQEPDIFEGFSGIWVCDFSRGMEIDDIEGFVSRDWGHGSREGGTQPRDRGRARGGQSQSRLLGLTIVPWWAEAWEIFKNEENVSCAVV